MRLIAVLSLLIPVFAQELKRQRILGKVTDTNRISRPGNVHPFLAQATEISPAEDTMLEDLILTLQSSPEQQAELEQLLEQQSDPDSPNYKKYLTPEAFAERFGPDPTDIAKVTEWLESHGLQVQEVAPGNGSIRFRGFSSQVARAFDTEIKHFTVNQVRHLANATDPKIPAALADTVGGVLRLHDFEYRTFARPGSERFVAQGITPAFSPLGIRWLSPGDYYTIYDINPLLSSGIDGTGQSIAVIARSNIYLSDIQGFRRLFGLKANDPQIIVTTAKDPGNVNGDNIETTLDTEWAGAVAPGATVKVIVSASSTSADGIDTSAIYAVTKNVAPIITVSYGACEAQMGTTALAFYNSLWKQAAAQGQTVLVASGDSGVAGCQGMNAPKATSAPGVNGLCSSPYSTCVGGTQFLEGSNPGQYWLPSNPSNSNGTAISYIPETVWNESGTVTGGGGLAAGGGGSSLVYPKPTWQTGPGVPADGKRNVPDLSLTAAAHDGYTVVQGGMIGFIFGVSGTSASTPSFAGIMALVNQRTNSPQGNINPVLYSLAARQAKGGAAVFHDIKTGDNSVPGLKGFAATTGYDQATGLGSVDANLLATMWNTGTEKLASLSVAANALNLNVGKSGSTSVTTVADSLKSAVTLSLSGLPAGVTASFAPSLIPAPGSGTSALTLTAGANVTPGTYTIKLTATAGTLTTFSNFSLTIATPSFTLDYGAGLYPSVNFGPKAPFTSQTINLKTFPVNGFNAPIALSATGLPAGITVAFAPATLAAGAVGTSVATVSVASTVKGGSYPFTIKATGGGVTQTVDYTAMVFVEPSCRLTPSENSISMKAGANLVLTLSCTSATPSTAPVTLTINGAPGGLTTKLSAPTVSAGKQLTLTLTATNSVSPGTYPLTISGSEASGARQDLFVYAAIATPVFSLSLNPAAVVATPGTSTKFDALVTPEAGFSNKVSVWIGSRPTGVTATFGPPPAGKLGNTITLTLDPTTVPGTYPLTIGAIANTGFSRTIVSTITVAAPPSLTLTPSLPTISVKAGKTAQLTLTTKGGGPFNAAVDFRVTGLPVGVTATFSKPSIAAPGSGSVTMTITASATAKLANYTIGLSSSGGGLTATSSLGVSVVR